MIYVWGNTHLTTEYSDLLNKIKVGIIDKDEKPFLSVFAGSCFYSRICLIKYLNFQYIFGGNSE